MYVCSYIHYIHTSSMISRLREMGFSQKIIFPALAAAMICPACWSVGEQITTASTSASLMSYHREANKARRITNKTKPSKDEGRGEEGADLRWARGGERRKGGWRI